jgi:benzylsuccinate CoA-transferase BbsF subunit
MEDPQLNHLGHFVTLPHADHGTIVVEGSRFALSDTPATVVRTPPYLGQDTVDVLLDELGYDDNRLGELYAVNALD